MRKQNPCRYRASITLNNHKRNGYIISVSIDEVEQLYLNTDVCPICGCILTHDLGIGQRQNASSLDRKNNENELRSDNIWIICHKCNAMKGSMSMKEYTEHSRLVFDKFKDEYL
jgi:5-methylcytosine-specific restriction endonuclease McrA